MICNNIINLNKTKYNLIKKRLFRICVFYFFILIMLLVINLYKINKTYNLKNAIQAVSVKNHSMGSKLYKLILTNNAINKSFLILNNIRLEKNPTIELYVNQVKTMVNNLAYYHKINSPITMHISYPPNLPHNSLSNISMDMSFHANRDKDIIRFVDSLTINLKGFLKIQEMEISKNKDENLLLDKGQRNLITCRLKLDWYVIPSHKAQKNSALDEAVKIYPKKPKIAIEDIYRISVWEESLMLPSDG